MMVVLSVLAGPAAAQTITSAVVSPDSVQGAGQTATFTINYNSGTRVVSSISVASEIGAAYNCTGYSPGLTNQNVTCIANYVTKVGDVGKTLSEIPVVNLVSNGVPTDTTYAGVLTLSVTPPLNPVIASISPNSGPVSGGNSVTITGSNFIVGSTTVVFEFDDATNVVVNSPTSLTATVPPGVEGTVEVAVRTQGGATGYLFAGYTYVSANPLSLNPSSLPNGTVGATYPSSFSTSGGAAPYSYAVTAGSLPAGLTLDPAGTFSGRPTADGTFNFTVTATDSSTGAGAPYSVSGVYSLVVGAPTITIQPTTLSAGQVDSAYSRTVTAANGTAPYSFAITGGALPHGVTLSTGGVLEGTPSVSGTFNFTVRATDSSTGTGPFSGARAYAWTITPLAPTVTSISPTAGPSTGGTTVIITGTGFSGTTAVTFGATAASGYTVNSATQITATAPAGTGTVDVRVTTVGGTSATSAADQFTYVAAPMVTSISPTAGPSTGGTTVTITGTNFSGTTAVTFGATAASGVTVNSATQITAMAPAGTGTVDVRVTTVGGTSATSAADQFTYVAAPTVTLISPTAGPATGGTTVIITGTNFSGAAAVTFGATAASGFTINSATQITAMAPAGTGTVDVRVTTIGGTSATSAADQFTFVGAPTVTSISPTSGPAAGGSTVIITGTRFSGATAVTFGATAATGFTVNSATQITATAPAGSGTVDVRVTTLGGTSATSAADLFTYSTAPITEAVSVTVAFGSSHNPVTLSVTGGLSTSVAVATPADHGTATASGTSIHYTPAAGYFGADSFTYTATGPGGTSAPATVTVTVSTPAAPVAAAAAVSAAYNVPTAIDLSGSITGVHTSLAMGVAPAHGTTSIAGDVVTYTPAAGYFGADSFTYTATGPGGTSSPATVALTVAAPPPPVIEQPTDPVVVTPPAGGGGSSAISVELQPASQGLIDGYRITAVSQFGVAEIIDGGSVAPARAGGSVGPRTAGTYQLLYTPAANFMGTDTVTLVAYGPGGDSAPVTFTFQVSGKAPNLSGQATSNASTIFAPTAGLVGGPFQALRITRAPGFGAATVNGLNIVFTPGVANGGATSLDYVIDLPFGASASGRIDLVSNLIPGSETLTARTLQGAPVTVRISNAPGGPFTGASVISVAPTSAGTATITGAGGVYDLTFTSTGTFSGETMVSYSLTNAFGTTNSTLAITVEARPDPSLDPEVRGVATSQVTSARRFADAQINNFQQRLRDLHDGTNGSSNGLSLNLGFGGADEARDPQQALRRQLGQGDRLDPGALGNDRDREMLGLDIWAGRAQTSAGPVGATDDRLNAASTQPAADGGASVGLWTSGSVDWGRQDATGQRDSRFTTQGATVGLDVKVSEQLIVGGGVGYGEDKTRIGDNGSVANGKAFTGALYASWRPAEAFYVDGLLGYANLDFTSRRWVEGMGGQSDGYADADRSGDVRFASAAFGRILRGASLTSDFYARLDARDIALDGFTETGGGLSALIWDDVEQKSLSANLGASWRWTLDSRRYGQFVPTARLEWSHEFEDIEAQGVRYADWAASPTYLVPLNAWSRNAINLNLGTDWSLSDRLMLSLGYRGALGDASSSHGVQFGMKYGW